MNEEEKMPRPPPNKGDESVRKVIWLFAAFFPSAIGIASLHLKNPGQLLFPVLVTLNLIFSVAASVGLVRGMKNGGFQFIIGFFLIPFFFVINALIVLFIGCSGMGRIAP
jgi:hypothetical protein